MKKESFKQGITDGIPIALGYLAVSDVYKRQVYYLTLAAGMTPEKIYAQ